MMRKVLIVFLLVPFLGLSQQPFINSIAPVSSQPGDQITVSGSNLSGTTQVLFGGVPIPEDDIEILSDNLLEVTVPSAATHDFISVISNNLIALSPGKFYPSFAGASLSDYDDEYLVASTETAVSDICLCDLDGDSFNDVVIAHAVLSADNSQSEVTIYRNNVAGSTAPLTSPDFELSLKLNNSTNQTGFTSAYCGDLNNDGKPDLAFTSNSGLNARDIYVYENTSTTGSISLTARADNDLKLGTDREGNNRIPRRIKIADIDRDGRNDLIVGNESDSLFSVFLNTSSFGFSAAVNVSVGNANNTGSIDLADFNKDGSIDVVILPFRSSNQPIYVMVNGSTPGTVQFDIGRTISTSGRGVNVIAADFNNDGFPDLARTERDLQRILIFPNTSTDGNITFGSSIVLSGSGTNVWGLDAGDMDGDGDLDIVAGATNTSSNGLFVFQNTSSGDVLSFDTSEKISVSSSTSNIKAGDLNGDGKPEMAFIHSVNSGSNGNLGIFINRNCVTPSITPSTADLCLNESILLTATQALGATYSWEILSPATGTIDADENEAEVTITSGSTANVRVTITQDQDETYECLTATTATYTILSGAQPSPPSFSEDADIVCNGDDYTLTVGGGTFDTWIWTKPDGSSETTTSASLNISSVSIADAGAYEVIGQTSGSCYSPVSSSFYLSVSQPPSFNITNANADNFCSDAAVTLSLPDFADVFSYQWLKDGSVISGQENFSITTNETGSYSVQITNEDGCTVETSTYDVSAIDPPIITIDGETEVCTDLTTIYTADGTGAVGFTISNEWEVLETGEGLISETSTFSYAFPSAQQYTLSLTSSYSEEALTECSSTTSLTVLASDAPVLTLSSENDIVSCPEETVLLSVETPPATEISNYSWSVQNTENPAEILSSSTNAEIEAATTQLIEAVTVTATIVTTIGCEVTETLSITNFPNSSLVINTPSDLPVLSQDSGVPLIDLEEETFVELSASGGSNYSWEPAASISDPDGTDVIFFPADAESTVTLSGIDQNGCLETYQLDVRLENLRPKKTFSPNGDGKNDCWEILNSKDLTSDEGCTIYIFDARGRNILSNNLPLSGQNENCIWEGEANGSDVPEGVYYFVLKCKDGALSKSGSILLAR